MNAQSLFVVDVNPCSTAVATLSSLQPFLQVDDLQLFESSDAALSYISGRKGRARYARAIVSHYPESRFLRHAILENPAKAREETFFDEFLKSQYQLTLSEYAMAALNPSTGLPLDFDKVVPKEIVLCGAKQEEILTFQEGLVAKGIYPERIEIGSLSSIGGLIHYLRAQQIGSSVIMLEWGQKKSTLAICSARRVELLRSVPFGAEALEEQVRIELGLKDAASAKKMLSMGSFDFAEMGPIILKKFLKELQASEGFFEVQTGQSLKNFIVTLLPPSLSWMQPILGDALGLSLLSPDVSGWLNTLGVKVRPESVDFSKLGSGSFSLLSLLANWKGESDEQKKIA